MKKSALITTLIAALFALNACSESESTNPDDYDRMDIDFSSHALALQKADSCDDYRRHLLDATAKYVTYNRFNAYESYDYPEYDMSPNAPGSNESAGDATNKPAGDFTITNTQEAGADELDIVKNDGTYMYTVRNSEIHITKVWPAESMAKVATIPSSSLENSYDKNYYINGILLDGNRLIAIESGYSWYAQTANFLVIVYDVTDPAHPNKIATHKIDGNFSDARLINHRLFIASSAYVRGDWYELHKLFDVDIPGVPKGEPFKWSWNDDDWNAYDKAYDAWRKNRDEQVKKYLPVIRAWLDKKYPSITDFDWPQYSDGKKTRDALGCSDLYLPSTTSSDSGLIMVSEISGNDYQNYKAQGVTDSGWLVYASAQNLYLVSNSYNWWWDCNANQDKSCNGLSHIHHFSLGDKDGGLRYINSGEVDGYVTDAFWMSDYDSHLRVVSSYTYWGNSEKGHKLSVLDNTTPSTMKLTGSVDGFGQNERIYSARMIKDKGYVVTFRNTDPLFTFDLSDPNAPKKAGELKINGYSSYIHPIGDTHLLTIGEDGDDNGTITGMKLELFDVTDLANPKPAAKLRINDEYHDSNSGSYGWSEALYDHHALNFHEASGLLAIPVTLAKWTYSNNGNNWNYNHFSGMFVYRVTPTAGEKAFEFVGGVDHAPVIDDKEHWWTSLDRARFYFQDKGVYDKNAYIYTISNHGILANDANNPDTMVSKIKF